MDRLNEEFDATGLYLSGHPLDDYGTAMKRLKVKSQADIIATGTCSGVGGARDTYLKAGDRVRMEIEELGTIENPVEGPRSA